MPRCSARRAQFANGETKKVRKAPSQPLISGEVGFRPTPRVRRPSPVHLPQSPNPGRKSNGVPPPTAQRCLRTRPSRRRRRGPLPARRAPLAAPRLGCGDREPPACSTRAACAPTPTPRPPGRAPSRGMSAKGGRLCDAPPSAIRRAPLILPRRGARGPKPGVVRASDRARRGQDRPGAESPRRLVGQGPRSGVSGHLVPGSQEVGVSGGRGPMKDLDTGVCACACARSRAPEYLNIGKEVPA